MRTLFGTLALSLAITVPAVAFAQTSNDPVTRTQVRSELVQLQDSGYKQNRTQYPADIQAAEARIAAQNPAAGNNAAAFGGTSAGTSQSGHRTTNAAWASPYLHH